MGKGILKFDLNDAEDIRSFKRCVKSLDLALAIWDIVQLRKTLERRYESLDDANKDVFDGINAFSSEISVILDNHGIILDEIIE